MKINYIAIILTGCISTITSCSGSKQKSDNTKEEIAFVEDNSEEDIPEEVKKTHAQADLETMTARRIIDERFEKLFEAQIKLTEAKKNVCQFEAGTYDYTHAQRQAELAENELQEILEDVNGRYAQIIGFLLSTSDSKRLIEAARDKTKAYICREIYEKYKQKALDEIEFRYTGVMPDDY